MVKRQLGRTGLEVTPLGFGAFKIGRNQGIKYPQAYDLPDMDQVDALLNGILDLGVNYIDTAPAYGLSEQRIGQTIAHRREEYVLATKVGETFDENGSTFDFSAQGIEASVHRSLKRLRTDVIDVVLIHSDGRDLHIINETDAVQTLGRLRDAGLIRHIGMSGKTHEGALASLAWADVIMVEYHADNRSCEPVMTAAADRGIGVVVKKGFDSGRLDPDQAIGFVLGNPAVGSLIVGTLSAKHMRDNIAAAGRSSS